MRKLTIGSLAVSAVALVGLAGCEACFEKPAEVAEAKPPPPPAPVAAPCPPCGTAAMQKMAHHLPGGQKQCSTVLVEKAGPERVNVGETFEYHVKVTNTAKTALMDVTLWDSKIPNFKITKVEPETTRSKEGWWAWDLGDLEPGETRTVRGKIVLVEGGPEAALERLKFEEKER